MNILGQPGNNMMSSQSQPMLPQNQNQWDVRPINMFDQQQNYQNQGGYLQQQSTSQLLNQASMNQNGMNSGQGRRNSRRNSGNKSFGQLKTFNDNPYQTPGLQQPSHNYNQTPIMDHHNSQPQLQTLQPVQNTNSYINYNSNGRNHSNSNFQAQQQVPNYYPGMQSQEINRKSADFQRQEIHGTRRKERMANDLLKIHGAQNLGYINTTVGVMDSKSMVNMNENQYQEALQGVSK